MSEDRSENTVLVVDQGRGTSLAVHAALRRASESLGEKFHVIDVNEDTMKKEMGLMIAALGMTSPSMFPEPPRRKPRRELAPEIQEERLSEAELKRQRRRQKRLQQLRSQT